jgi:hypothetical protein
VAVAVRMMMTMMTTRGGGEGTVDYEKVYFVQITL